MDKFKVVKQLENLAKSLERQGSNPTDEFDDGCRAGYLSSASAVRKLADKLFEEWGTPTASTPMFVYHVGYYSYEESPSHYLTHGVEFDQAEFQQLVLTAIEAILRKWLTLNPDQEAFDSEGCHPDTFQTFTQFGDLVGRTVDWLVAERGFALLSPTASIGFDGWSPLVGPSFRDGRDPEPINVAVQARLGELGLTALVVERNKKISAVLELPLYEGAEDDDPST